MSNVSTDESDHNNSGRRRIRMRGFVSCQAAIMNADCRCVLCGGGLAKEENGREEYRNRKKKSSHARLCAGNSILAHPSTPLRLLFRAAEGQRQL
jgi:hypothetical protein